ncbi:glycosyltransferase family 8 protein [Pedobacter hiemivivus]|uniref:Glycosyltransferase family 8 protein n=1 Tax=Pedobacter hiemivivus TaxID=2530454 RepID=A0A4R0NCA0_9SPHI|nr:glycosyltransferase [Pedobacter hiemivivus]TCC97277.1 glycosyltransferase family 8 protein [Pedobacter hiemivivus]TKC59265.1 glycosyltransferase family 8 protein [Pedobacter hiemivivus]
MQEKRISIVLVCDDYYAVLLAAFLKSIELNHKEEEIIDVYIVDDSISKKSRVKIIDSLNHDKIQLHWIEMENAIPKDVNLPFINNAYPLNILVRLLIPYFIPAQVEKIIYFDVDMIMLDDISNLWNIDIGESIIGAISDTIGPKMKTIGNGIENYKELGLDGNQKYFNSGLQVINIKKWLDADITRKAIDAIANNKKYASLSDQYGLNVALIGQWHEIDPTWSCFSVNTILKPSLIHYFHRKPIYKEYSYNYKEEFFFYLKQTQWRNFKPIGKSSRYLKKIKNMFQKVQFVIK